MNAPTSHTPGPWKAVMQFGDWFVRQDPKDWDGMGYQHIATLPADRKGTHYGDMFKANAHLIAAAPDLLTACTAMVEAEDALLADLRAEGKLPDLTEKPWSLVDAMRAAIAKANGQ